ncbi:cytochrome P450 736A117-like isoform X1 [Malania oleifera]|uniref:cytochrome P450 736A117-like isoform X1 n=1 Tax=Malania oleifera TaxID=397392 RepID=UPI0025ADA487|nr:cytochrome P450 736A117-like isoform X1 [Malania oleifera]
MEAHNLHAAIFNLLSLLFPILLFFLLKWLVFTNRTSTKRLPPSPPKLPIMGNLHQLGQHPHRTLRGLAQRHGPLMLLHFGWKPTLIVSSANAASEILKAHDTIFANRPYSSIPMRLFYNYKDVAAAPYGSYWRQMKSICITQLLSSTRVQSFRAIREEEMALMMKKIKEYSHDIFDNRRLEPSCSQKQYNYSSDFVNLSELFTSLTSGVICRVAFGRKYKEGEGGGRFRKLLEDMGVILGAFDVGDFIPWLGWVSYVNGLKWRVEKLFRKIDVFLDKILDDHMASGNKDQLDFVDVLLEIQKSSIDGEHFMGRDNIKAMILDMFAAGTETTSVVLEWAMIELLRHPKMMKKVQKDIRVIAGSKAHITEDDTKEMHYLKAVIKETLRLHPPLPLLLPRESTKDIKILGYDVLGKTQVFINAWAIGRDPKSWEEAEEFVPKWFLNNPIDFRGHDFQLIPLGAGRRGCPGGTFAIAIIELVLANLLHRFDWALPKQSKDEDLDLTECTGISIHRKIPLVVCARDHYL